MSHYVHMRDQKANQVAILNRKVRQNLIKLAEEFTLLMIIWGLFLLTKLS